MRHTGRIKFISFCVAICAIVLTVIFLILGGIAGKNIEGEAQKKSGLAQDCASANTKITELTSEVSQKTEKKESLQAVLTAKQAIAAYKANPTAMLSFDDGPNEYTDDILDVLKEYDVKATFYIIASQAEDGRYDAVMRRIVDEGHAVGIHCYEHVYKKIYASEDAYFNDLYKAAEIIDGICGIKTMLVRLPGGTSSAKSFCEKYSGSSTLFKSIIQRLKAEDYTVSDWNIDTRDWSSATTSESIANTVISGAEKRLEKEYKVALVLMHNTKKSLEALPTIIPEMKNLGYIFEAMKQYGYTFLQRTE